MLTSTSTASSALKSGASPTAARSSEPRRHGAPAAASAPAARRVAAVAVALADRAVGLLDDVLDLVLAGAVATGVLDSVPLRAAIHDALAALKLVAPSAVLKRHRPHVAI